MISTLSIIESSIYGGDEDEDDDPTVPPSLQNKSIVESLYQIKL